MTPAVKELLTNLVAIEIGLTEENMPAIAKMIAGFVRTFHKANETPPAEMVAIDWRAFAAQIDLRAGAMARENALLPPAARNTPFGVMTGTATIILSMLAEALDVAGGAPQREAVDAMIARIQSDRGALALAKLGLNPKA